MSYYSILVVQLTCVVSLQRKLIVIIALHVYNNFCMNWQEVFRIWLKNYKNDVIPLQIYIYFAIVLTHELTRTYLKNKVIYYLRNRKHVSCFYRVIETWVEVWENEKCCGNTSRRWVFPQLFRADSQTFTSASLP